MDLVEPIEQESFIGIKALQHQQLFDEVLNQMRFSAAPLRQRGNLRSDTAAHNTSRAVFHLADNQIFGSVTTLLK